MVHPQYFKNRIDENLEYAMKSAENAEIESMQSLVDNAEGILKTKMSAFNEDIIEQFAIKKEKIYQKGYTLAFEKNYELAKQHSMNGNIKSMKKAMNLAEKYSQEIKINTPDFSEIEKQAYTFAEKKMIDYATEFAKNKNESGMNRAILLAQTYSKKTNNDLTKEFALIKQIAKNNYTIDKKTEIMNYSTQQGPLDIIYKN